MDQSGTPTKPKRLPKALRDAGIVVGVTGAIAVLIGLLPQFQ
jgi:hypothetical protein